MATMILLTIILMDVDGRVRYKHHDIKWGGFRRSLAVTDVVGMSYVWNSCLVQGKKYMSPEHQLTHSPAEPSQQDHGLAPPTKPSEPLESTI